MRPNFLIVGTAKSGSTSLMAQLAEHPEVYVHPDELHFFDRDENWRRGPQWYEARFAGAPRRRCVGDKTPSYCYIRPAAERIHRTLPDAKLVWILREPVARAYSNYWHSVSFGKERLDFATAVRREPERVRRDPYRGYLARGRYAEQLERFQRFFPREQMHVLVFEEYLRDERATLESLARFLEIGPFDLRARAKRENVTRIPRSRTIEWAARSVLGPGPLYRAVRKLNRRREPGYPPLDPALRAELEEYFDPHNRALEALLGRPLDLWAPRAARAMKSLGEARARPPDERRGLNLSRCTAMLRRCSAPWCSW